MGEAETRVRAWHVLLHDAPAASSKSASVTEAPFLTCSNRMRRFPPTSLLSVALVVATACALFQAPPSESDDDDEGPDCRADVDCPRNALCSDGKCIEGVMPPSGGTGGAATTTGGLGGMNGTGAGPGGGGTVTTGGAPTGGRNTGGTAGTTAGSSGRGGTGTGGTGTGGTSTGGTAGSGGKATAGTRVATLPGGTRPVPGYARWNVPSNDATAIYALSPPYNDCSGGLDPCFWVHGGMLYLVTAGTTSLADSFHRVPTSGGTFELVYELDYRLELHEAHAVQNHIVFITSEYGAGYRRVLTSLDMASEFPFTSTYGSDSQDMAIRDFFQLGVTLEGTYVYAHWLADLVQGDPTFRILTFAVNGGPTRSGVFDATFGSIGNIRASYSVHGGDATEGGELRTATGSLVESYPFQICAALQEGNGWIFVTPTGDVHRDPDTDVDGSMPIATGQQAVGLHRDQTSAYFSANISASTARVVRRWNRTTMSMDTVLVPHATLDTFGVYDDGFIYYTVAGENAIYRAELPP